MKVNYCKIDACPEKCIPRWASVLSVVFGCVPVASYFAYTVNARAAKLLANSSVAGYEIHIALTLIAVVLIVTIFFSLWERFEHPLTGFIFGASTPGLLYGLSNLLSVR